MKRIPPIEALMNPIVDSYEGTVSVRDMLSILGKKSYRHVPVKENGCLVGIVGEQDLLLAKPDENLGRVCNRSMHIVDAEQRVDQVLELMWKERLDAVLVKQDGQLAGIFTVMDACFEFSEFLRLQVLDEPLPYVIS